MLKVMEARAMKLCEMPSEGSVTFLSGGVTNIQNTVRYNELLQIEILRQQNTDTSSCPTCTFCLWGHLFMRGEMQIHILSHTFLLRSTSLSDLVWCVWYTNPDRTTNAVRESTERRRCKTVAHQTQLKDHKNWLHTACFYHNDTSCEVWDLSIRANKIVIWGRWLVSHLLVPLILLLMCVGVYTVF